MTQTISKRIRRGSGSYSSQRSELQLWNGLLPYFAQEFAESKSLLLDSISAETRAAWCSGVAACSLRDTFEDLLQAAGVSTYLDGSTAFLGAYMSLYDFAAAKVVCAGFGVDELTALRAYYEEQRYLSPIFGLVAGSCRDALTLRSSASEASSGSCTPSHSSISKTT